MRFTTALKPGLAVLALFAQAAAVAAATMQGLVSYRGVYDMQLENMSGKSGINGLSGRLVYEFNGSKCEGYTTRFRFITRVDMKEAPSRLTDQQTTSFESSDGREFRFASKSYIDRELIKEVVGAASRAGTDVRVRLTRPEEAEYKLNLAEFPVAHMMQIIRNAVAGKRFFHIRLFDGSEDADELTETTVVVGRERKPQPDPETPDPEKKVMGRYADKPFWPVTVSYFNDDGNRDGLPAYRTSFLLYGNGITRDLFMDYGDFSIRGRLVHFDILDRKPDPARCIK